MTDRVVTAGASPRQRADRPGQGDTAPWERVLLPAHAAAATPSTSATRSSRLSTASFCGEDLDDAGPGIAGCTGPHCPDAASVFTLAHGRGSVGVAAWPGSVWSGLTMRRACVRSYDIACAVADGVDVGAVSVWEYMTSDPATVSLDTEVDEAVAAMLEFDFRHLPVVQAVAVVGMVSLRDLMSRALAAT